MGWVQASNLPPIVSVKWTGLPVTQLGRIRSILSLQSLVYQKPWCPGTHHIDQAAQRSACLCFRVLEIKACTAMPGYKHKLFNIEYKNIRNRGYNSLVPLIFYFKHVQINATNYVSSGKHSVRRPPLLSYLCEQFVASAQR